MKQVACVGFCRVCRQGRLIIARDRASGVMYVLCEECESEWASPEEIVVNSMPSRDTFGLSTYITREELKDHPWEGFLEG